MYKKSTLLIVLLFSTFLLRAQAGSEIYLFSLSSNGNTVTLSDPKNITNHKGYDNQPSFHPGLPLIYFSSFDDSGRSDLKYYNYKTGATTNLTKTREREYSPTVAPNAKYISCILQRDNGVQDLCEYPVKGGDPVVLINTLKVGYHVWINNTRLLLFVLRDSSNELHYFDLSSNSDKVVAKNPGRSLQKIPGEDAMSFIEKTSKETWTVKRFDNRTGTVSIISAIPPLEDMAWLNKDVILFSKENQILVFERSVNKWSTAVINGDADLFKKITRLAIHPARDKIAVVVAE